MSKHSKSNRKNKEESTKEELNKKIKNHKAKHASGKNRLVLSIIQIILIVVMVISAIQIFLWWQENQKNEEILNKLSNAVTVIEEPVEETDNTDGENKDKATQNKYQVNFEDLKEQNSDTVAWLKVPGTTVDFAVVRRNNNSFYLNHTFDGSYNTAGWIFMDYRNTDIANAKNIIIYGHNRLNESMFGSLRVITSPEWYDKSENRFINFITEEENALYEVFSVYQIEEEDYYITTNFSSEDSFDKFVNVLKNRSLKDYGVEVNGEDHILTLSTCATNSYDYRIVLHAKKL